MQNAHQTINMFANLYFCKQIRKKMIKNVCTQNKQQKIPWKMYVSFFTYVLLLLAFNQISMAFFKSPNLYEEIQCPRSYSLGQIKTHGQDLKIKIMSFEHISIEERISKIKELQQKLNVLSHPARRLSYDAFGVSDVTHAWAFKYQQFLISMIIQSAVFYAICTLMNLVSTNRTELKQALKTEMIVMILLFIWQVDLILTTQSRLHSHSSDFLDKFYFAFPLFQRRDAIKSILMPSMNLMDIFIRCFIKSNSYNKIKLLGLHPQIRNISNHITQKIPVIDNNSPDYQQKINKYIDEAGTNQKYKKASQIFKLNRKIILSLFTLDKQNVLIDSGITRIINYFKFKTQKSPK